MVEFNSCGVIQSQNKDIAIPIHNHRSNRFTGSIKSNKSLKVINEESKNAILKNTEDKNNNSTRENLSKEREENNQNADKNRKIKKNLNNNIGLESISEQAELNINSKFNSEKKEKDIPFPSFSNIDVQTVLNNLNQSKHVVANRALKESDQNMFKNLIDLSDIIEFEPEVENSLKDVENILLRNLSEMKMWYRLYTNNESNSYRDDINSVNQSILNTNTQNEEKEKTKEGNGLEKNPSYKILNTFASVSNNTNNIIINEGIYNNDLSFAMEMKDLWKFLRDSNVISSEFSLAQFNRLFFKGKKNYIEMFLIPEEIDNKYIYDYI